jgi:Restriction endonuclease AspBHI N-terminal
MPVDQPPAVPFDDLVDANLLLERVYRGGVAGNVGDDPLARLLPVGNQGGFRTCGRVIRDTVKLAVLYTTGAEPDWPDALDVYTGIFTYFGDNRSPAPLTGRSWFVGCDRTGAGRVVVADAPAVDRDVGRAGGGAGTGGLV